MDRYMFTCNQMFTRNNKMVPLANRVIDFMMGGILFTWSQNVTKVQNAASIYSMSYNVIKKYDFFDTNADAICDDYHNSSRMIWKTQGNFVIVHIPVMANMLSLQSGEGYISDLKCRFWQA